MDKTRFAICWCTRWTRNDYYFSYFSSPEFFFRIPL